MVLPYYVYGHFKSLLSRKYIWMQCKWPQYDMCRYILQMLLPNATFLRQFESCMMFAKVWLQFTNMFSWVAEVRGLGVAIHAPPPSFLRHRKENWSKSRQYIKGQLISEWNFGIFKSPKKPTKFLTDFCPSFIWQKSVWNLVGFLGDLKTPKFHSEINWPLSLTQNRTRNS